MSNNFQFTYKGPAMQNAAPAATGLRGFDLFATRIWQARLAELQAHFPAWAEAALALRAARPQTAGRTNRHGWNSEEMDVLEQPTFKPLRALIYAHCRQALSEMGVGELPFRLQSWFNLHDKGGYNILHVHQGSLLSGGCYLQAPPGSGRLVFRDPRPGTVHGYVMSGLPNGYCDVHLTPEPGLLALFPHWLEHFVEPHENDAPRVMIAFNAIQPF
jgi:uncharacterized protein (TIGR02466 family)